jgi:hypothetical protein
MNRETIKSASGRTLGYKLKVGNRTVVQDSAGGTCGWHDENTDKTFDGSGKPLYDGDQTSALIEEP